MIHLIGVSKHVDLKIRGILSIPSDILEDSIMEIRSFAKEVVIISTCNRTEIYINSALSKDEIKPKIFEALGWNLKYDEYTFHYCDMKAAHHLFKVCCGFHSKILGEDQILGQAKDAYYFSKSLGTVKGELEKLFLLAISCGKEFKTETALYKVPVSYPSLAVKTALDKGVRNIMIMGFGKMATLSYNYIKSNINSIDKIYIVARNVSKTQGLLEDFDNTLNLYNNKIKIVPLADIKKYYSLVQCIICCTASEVPLVYKKDLPNNPLCIFDLSMPANIDSNVNDLPNVELYDIDHIHLMDDENRKLRKDIMYNHFYIIDNYMKEFEEYLAVCSIKPTIKKLKSVGNNVYKSRLKSYKSKTSKNKEVLADTLIKSASYAYVNKAIEVLKEETLNGNGEIALSIIEKIFSRCE